MHNEDLFVIAAQSQPNMKSLSERNFCREFITPATSDSRRTKTDPLRGQKPHTPCADWHKRLKAARQTEHPADLGAWLSVRRSEEPFQFRLLVLKPSAKPIGPESSETIVIALEERVTFLDDQPICRYFVLDGNGPLDHYPVVRNLLGLCMVANRTRCLVKGRIFSKSACTGIEDGKLLIPAALKKSTRTWEPDVVFFRSSTNESPWLKQLRVDVAEDLPTAIDQ